jgi:hypothetical protein
LGFKDVSLKKFKAGPWDLFWIGNAKGGEGMAIFQNREAYEGPMSKDALATGLPLTTLSGANNYRGGIDITFAEAQQSCLEGKARALEVRTQIRAVGTPKCYFGRPGLYMHYAFAFEREALTASSPACQKEFDALDKTEFAALKCKKDWGASAFAMYADWSGGEAPEIAFQAIWDIATDF